MRRVASRLGQVGWLLMTGGLIGGSQKLWPPSPFRPSEHQGSTKGFSPFYLSFFSPPLSLTSLTFLFFYFSVAPKSHEILMFVWCSFVAGKMPNKVVSLQSLVVLVNDVCLSPERCQTMLWWCKFCLYSSTTSGTMSTTELCNDTTLFGIFLETNKHQNLS